MLKKKILLGLLITLVVLIGGFFIFTNTDYVVFNKSFSIHINKTDRPQKLKTPPSPIKGVYATSWVAGNEERIADLIDLINSTELNAIVIDVKDYSGELTFDTGIPLAEEAGAHDRIRVQDIDALVNRLHEDDIYIIGRVQVFQDPTLAKAKPEFAITNTYNNRLWRDTNKLSWLDPANYNVWQYVMDIAKSMDEHGFDEVNFDYIRFPTDGALEAMDFPFWDEVTPKHETISAFFGFLKKETEKENITFSADIFGMAAWRALDFWYDLNIGQRMVDAIEYFDIVAPMVYPSHYATDVTGFKNPAKHPYEVILNSLIPVKELIATTSSSVIIRPWLQDFDIGAEYGKTEIREQIRAVYDVGFTEWLMWNPSSRYTKEAFLPE